MNTHQKLELIDGKFNAEEASEILLNLYADKIRFHKLKNFISQERLQKNDETAILRIPQLKQDSQRVSNLIKEATTNNMQLDIKYFIQIGLSEVEL